jgi:hypothetical protein
MDWKQMPSEEMGQSQIWWHLPVNPACHKNIDETDGQDMNILQGVWVSFLLQMTDWNSLSNR